MINQPHVEPQAVRLIQQLEFSFERGRLLDPRAGIPPSKFQIHFHPALASMIIMSHTSFQISLPGTVHLNSCLPGKCEATSFDLAGLQTSQCQI